MFGNQFFKWKWLKIDVDQIERVTDTGQLKELHMTTGRVILKEGRGDA